MSNIQAARGFRDFDPESKRQKEDLLAKIRATYRRYGFDEIETPVVEPLDRLRSSDGGENTGMIFEILRRGLTREDLEKATTPAGLCDLGLRYDLTVPLARFFASNQGRLPEVLRSIQIGPVWRAERPQKGRYRQFTQCDIDIIGDPSSLAEPELIIATLAALDAIGLRGATVRINDRRFLDALLATSGVRIEERPRALIAIDKLDKVGLDGIATALLTVTTEAAAQALVASLRRMSNNSSLSVEDFLEEISTPVASAAVADHRSTISAVRAIRGATSIRFDPTLVRGLGYYTGPIFEIEHPASKSSVAGGGRYDDMIGKFLGRPVPACGFSLGFDRLLEITANDVSATNRRVALVFEAEADYQLVLHRQQELLNAGYSVRLARAVRNMKRLFAELSSSGYSEFQRVTDPLSLIRKTSVEE